MKANLKQSRNPSVRLHVPYAKQHAYWAAIGLASLACGGLARAQTTNAPASGSPTNTTKLQETTVVGKLDVARSQILPDLGASSYTITSEHIESIPGGENAPFNQILLRAPGVAQDSAVNGDLHVRGEHANLQYRINDVLLPEGISGFGLELDPRFVDSVKLITGALPAQYGFRTAGIVDITTKSGAFVNGGEGEVYGGSYDTIRPSFEYAGSTNNFSYYVDGSFEHTSLGLELPTSSHDAIHDKSDQGKLFSYMSYILDDTSRLTLMLSASDSNFQVPNAPGNTTPAFATAPGQPATLDSANVNENQKEQNYYVALTYQKSAGDLNLQVSAIGRSSSVHFIPDQVGDLYFNGVASDVDRKLTSGGLQADASYQLGENHTLRGGALFIGETVAANTSTTVFPVDTLGNVTGPAFPIQDNHNLYGLFTGIYLQDEWKIFPKVTINYGARFDVFNSSFDNENQLSPRVNLVYKPWDATTMHAGYARYFTPPPVENVSGSDVALFNGTSNQSAVQQDDHVKAERADYFDVGINQEIATGFTVGVDGYYKHAKNQLDDGLFGQSLILSAFNYAQGQVEGVEFTGNYTKGGFSTYANVAIGDALGKQINSSQFLFDPAKLAFTQNEYVHLDHLQTVSGSFGTSYLWKESKNASLLAFVDAIYGTGLRSDLTTASGTIPNGAELPDYYSVNVGLEQRFKVGKQNFLKARLDVVNLTDRSYVLRNGTGIGVGAPQFGQRRSFYGTLGFQF
ncbi:MAG: tonB dependent receptor family protein [Pedosphaera sp.]|nr:tonB dependent receptor family protein [Pedosphaera sp.]